MKNFQLFNWLCGSRGKTANIGSLSGQTRKRHVLDTYSTRTRIGLLPYLCTLILLTLGVGQMGAKTIYLVPGVWETNGNDSKTPSFWVHSWGSSDSDVKMTPADNENANHIYKATVPDGNNNFIFTRCKSDATTPWDGEYNRFQKDNISSYNCAEVAGWDNYNMNANLTTATVYFASNATNVYVNVNRQVNTKDLWSLVTMTSIGQDYGGKPLYSATFNMVWGGVGVLQFKEDDSWGSKIIDGNSITSSSTFAGKLYNGSSWVALQYDVDFDEEGGSGGSYPSTVTVGSTMTSITTAPSKTGYDFDGYYDGDNGTGTKYWNANRTGAQTCAIDGPNQFYAKWTAKTTTITLNANTPDGAEVTGGGTTLTATYNLALPSFDALTCTNGYNLTGYYTSSDEKVINANGTFAANSGIWNRTDGSTLTLYAHWNKTNSLTVEAGSNISSVAGSTSPVTLGNKYAISATPNTGYSFSGWTASPAANGTFDDASAENTYVTVNNGSVTVTGAATENMTTVTVNVSPAGAGTLTKNAAAFTPGSTVSVGVTTGYSMVATANPGYVFHDWTMTGNAAGTPSTNTFPLKGDGSAGTGTLTANFGVASGWYIYGNAPWGGTWTKSDATAQLTYSYRGMSGVYYIPTTMSSDKYFRITDKSTGYNFSSNTGSDLALTKGTIYTLANNESKATYSTTNLGDVWVVVNTNDTKKAWVQSAQTFHNVNLSGVDDSKGPVKVTLNTTSAFTKGDNVFETTQFANGETFTVTVTGVSGWIPTITIGGETTTFWKEAASYSADGTMSTSDVSVTISYTASYAVTFAKTTGCGTLTATGPDATISTGNKVKSGTSITFTQTATHAGYDFSSWNSASTGDGSDLGGNSSGLTKSITAATSVYPIYTTHTFTGGTLDEKEGSTGGSYSVTYLDTKITPSAPSRTGYDVEGYYIETGRTTKVAEANGDLLANKTYTDGSKRWTYTSSETPPTLFTQWQAQEYSVSLDDNGDYQDNGSAMATYDATTLSSITPPQRTGYHVTGYYGEAGCTNLIADAEGNLETSKSVSGTAYTDASNKWIKTSGATLYASWEPSSYTVTFNDHGATIHGTTSATATYTMAMPVISLPTKDGFIFGGYWTEENGTGTKYYDEHGVGVRNWDIALPTELHACWTGISYHVEFNENGGTGSMENQDLTYGVSTALSTNTFTREGYYFLGWNTNADGSGDAHYDGKSVSGLTTVPGETVTLFAQWTQTHTLYLLNTKLSWSTGDNAATTTRYAYAFMYYDGQKLEPLGAFSSGTKQGTQMTAAPTISLPNVSGGQNDWCWSISDVPEGATIIFSDNTNTDGHKTGDLSGWTAEKPYYCHGNGTWYALDGTNQISEMTNMSVHIGEGDFGGWRYYALDKHDDGTYAIIYLNKNQTYQYKYSNWFNGGESGTPNNDGYIITSSTTADYGGKWKLDGDKNVMLQTSGHASGEYKFELTFDGDYPETKVYLPRGVNLTTTNPMEAKAGESVTVSFQADAWTDLSAGAGMNSHPTYYFEFSTDERNWTTVATVSPTSDKMRGTATYTFTAQNGYFRVKLVNDHGLASYSGSTAFTAYSTRSFYVYNPYNDDTNKWQYLELYTWNGSTKYNGNLGDCYIDASATAGTHANGCLHGNDLVAKGNNWFYVTIDERADKFILAGNNVGDNYASHKTVDCSTVNYIQDAKYMIVTKDDSKNYVEAYETKSNTDYRLKYTDASGDRYSPIYNTALDGTTVTTSMWMNAASGTSLVIEQGDGSGDWTTVKTYTNSSNGFNGLIGTGYRAYGYVFQMKLNMDGESSTITNVEEYNGPYYVRTDGLEGGWNVYKTSKHLMHKSEASLPAYNYYLCKWIDRGGTNAKFTIANDYNLELVAMLANDVNEGDPLHDTQNLPSATNVRFSWNSRTNTLTRAYLSAATVASSRFLVLVETSSNKIYNSSGTALTAAEGGQVEGLNEHELLFEDKGNWVYQIVMKANPGAAAKVTAKYNNKEPEFIPNTTLIGGNGDTEYTYRIVYDFKTNILTNAWVADGQEIKEIIDLNTNVMVIRDGQNAATQVTFNEDGKINKAKKLIGVMEFKYNNMVGRMSTWNSQAYQYCMYYISFPFDVKVSDIFGIGTYGTDWKLQYYDGAERAAKGFFKGDGTSTFWKDMPANETMQANVGYSLLLNRIKFNSSTSDIWENKTSGSSVYLYFPSTADVGTISHVSAEINVPAHYCTKGAFTDGQEKSHNITDSHWNMLGIPILANESTGDLVTFLSGEGTDANFRHLYAWDYSDNSLGVERVTGSFTFHAMKSYMVQFYGHITFTGAGISSNVAARRTVETNNYNIELQVLNTDEQMINHAYVSLEEGANADFVLNEDLYMDANKRAVNIYTFAGHYDVAANVLPIENTTVKVGVIVKTAGTYTFHMPDNFSGTVTLVDKFNNVRTNLAMDDYEVYLEKGEVNERFELELNINNAPTAIDGVEGGSLKDGKAHKFIMNNEMYILKDGVLYDARGAKVQ